jgi:hypothetical protein
LRTYEHAGSEQHNGQQRESHNHSPRWATLLCDTRRHDTPQSSVGPRARSNRAGLEA